MEIANPYEVKAFTNTKKVPVTGDLLRKEVSSNENTLYSTGLFQK